MLTNFSSPVLSVSVDTLKDLDGSEALASLWFLFSKCQSSLSEGRRLENISWRLWSQRIASKSLKYRPLTPDSPSEGVLTHGPGTATTSLFFKDTRTFPPQQQSIGKILCDYLPNSQHSTQSSHPKLQLPGRFSKAELEIEAASVLPTPAAELLSISIIPPTHSNEAAARTMALTVSTAAAASQASGGSSSSKSVFPIIGSHASPLQSNLSFPNSGTNAIASPFPLVVVVNPTPNPTPHPTPPATPVLPAPDAIGHTHVPLPQRMPPDSPTLPRDRRQRNLALTTALDSMPAFQDRLSAHSSSIPTNLLPPSPSANTSSSVTSTYSTNSNSSHLTASSSTSIHSNDTRSPNATLKPHDARIFFLKHDERSSGSSDEPSPVRPDITTFTVDRSDAHSNQAQSPSTTSSALGSYPPGIGNSNRDSSHPSGLTSRSSMSAGGSWGESDASDRRCHSVSKSNKSSVRGSSSGRISGSSDSRSRSRSHGPAHDGLMVTSRKKAHGSLVAGRRGTRLGANGAPPQTRGLTRAQGQVASGDSLQLGTASSSAHEQNRSEEKSAQAHGVQQPHSMAPYPRRSSQTHSATQGRRAMFNIGSHSPSGSPSNTDLSASSQAKTTSLRLANAGSNDNTSSPTSPGRMHSPVHLPPIATRAALPLHPPAPNLSTTVSPRLPRGVPHATSNLSAAEAMIQAPRTKRVVLADDDDDDWDETETDFDSDYEDDRKSDIDAEKGGTLVESGAIEGNGNNDGDDGDWVSEGEETGSGEAALAAPSSKKTKAPAPAPTSPVPSENNLKRRPGVSRHQSQPNIRTTTAVSKQKQQPVIPEQNQQLSQARPQARPQYRPGQPRTTSRRSDYDQAQALEQKFRDAALEAQRQREMFTKVPKRNYSNLSTRSQSGFLSQLMNPDPKIFPGDHPYSRGYSSGDVAVGGRTARLGIQPMTNLAGNVETRSNRSNLTTAAPGPSAARGPPSSKLTFGPSPTVPSVSKIVPLRPTKSAVALPVSNSVTASSYKGDINMLMLDKGKGKERLKEPRNGSASGYRPKGRPQDEEMEDESEDDRDQTYHISKSVSEKLAAFADRQTAKKGSNSSRAGLPPVLPLQPDTVAAPHPHRPQYVPNTHEQISTPPVQVPLPLGFPYNLPLAAPPSSPRTTRQLMLRTEMSESFRHNLVWSRKVIKEELAGPRRKSSSALSPGLQPLTAFPTVVHLTEKKKSEAGESNPQDTVQEDEDDLMEEMRPAKMQRNRSWAGGGR
ncbi:hypothetical protein GGU10DRAFT_354566 [Lentinula aff. detonsa]|uniref:Nitrogen regulatory protein areA GATA-like domain-containing protein n=1 Tax=Lentinula aff. detonsa TaxID=2804958 RepID=A0AA38KEK9_9AGAR|nr:hypothetical protein GGU10DRAFT_354566 [Lentinula aff. detonsa]